MGSKPVCDQCKKEGEVNAAPPGWGDVSIVLNAVEGEFAREELCDECMSNVLDTLGLSRPKTMTTAN